MGMGREPVTDRPMVPGLFVAVAEAEAVVAYLFSHACNELPAPAVLPSS